MTLLRNIPLAFKLWLVFFVVIAMGMVCMLPGWFPQLRCGTSRSSSKSSYAQREGRFCLRE